MPSRVEFILPLVPPRRSGISPFVSPFFCTPFPIMAVPISSDSLVLLLGIVLAALYLYRDQVFNSSSKPKSTSLPAKEASGHGNPRDFVAKMKAGVGPLVYLAYIIHLIVYRKNALSFSMAHKLGQLRNTPSVSLRRRNPSLVLPPLSVTPKNMTSRIWMKFPRTVPQFS